ncbi:MAG: S41 family peptidase [Planctomycetota bacterium]|jgi:C-terminal peptidase prc
MQAQFRRPLVLILALFATTALAQEEGGSIRELKVREVLAAAKSAEAGEIGRYSEKLVELGAASKRAIIKGIREADTPAKLAGLRALIELGSPTLAAEKLMEIAGDDQEKLDYRLVALELVGISEELDAEEGLLDLLTELNPELRIATARALWRLDAPESHRAKTVLREFLTSTNAELRAQGAMALAEMGDGDTPGVMDELRRLRREPGQRGQLARALYDKLMMRKALDRLEAQSDKAGARRRSRWMHLDELRMILQQYYDSDGEIDDNELKVGSARGMVNFPEDPHTVFMSPEQYQEFLHGSDGVDPSYGGIGAFIDTNVTDRLRILRPMFGGPAWDADIRGGDEIVAVDGKTTVGRSITEIIRQVKGPPGTPVVLTVIRRGWLKPKDIRVIRDRIVIPSVYSRMLPGKVGLVVVAQFAAGTGKELLDHLNKLEADGMEGLVIDLRDNPGGLLQSVVGCLTAFLNQGDAICTVRGRVLKPERHVAEVPDKRRRYPVSVLINGRSASGAELMSGVMQHYSKSSKRASADKAYLDALVLGENSFGKGTVQHTLPLRSWPGEPFVDTPRKNGYYNGGERFEDKNGNGRWDPGEPFEDRARKNNRWNDAEPWKDKNGNGKWDPGEEFTDENKDGVWQPAEQFTDTNGNATYDNGAAIKLTVARYYLPDGSNFTRKRVEKDGETTFEGGVTPDIATEIPDMKFWEVFEARELQGGDQLKQYVEQIWKTHKEQVRPLAWFDGRDPSKYPGFDEFYATLDTHLNKQIIRRLVRIELRREVAKEIGRDIVGDLSDDTVLVDGARSVLERLGKNPDAMPEYQAIAKNGAAETK